MEIENGSYRIHCLFAWFDPLCIAECLSIFIVVCLKFPSLGESVEHVPTECLWMSLSYLARVVTSEGNYFKIQLSDVNKEEGNENK